MKKIKKQRWMALFLAAIILVALLPDSFISAIGVLAQETEESGDISKDKDLEEATPEGSKNLQKTGNDDIPEKKNVTLTFDGVGTSEKETFSYSLYQGQDEIIVKLDIDTENQTTKSDETGIEVLAEKNNGSIIITIENLSSDKNYTYKLESTGDVKYQTVNEAINLENANAPITLVQIVEAVNPFAPTLTVTYENIGTPYIDENLSEKKCYYKGRIAVLRSDEGDDKIDIKALREEIAAKISVTTADTSVPLTLMLSDNLENGTYNVTDETGDIVLKISEWNQTNNSYDIEFIKNGEYSWGDIDYANNAGDKANINFIQDDKTFIIDNAGPEAQCYINIFPKINENREQKSGYLFDPQKDYTLSLATNLSDSDKSEFCLENAEDKYSGISKVEYYIFEQKQDAQSLENWTGWNDGTSDVIDNTKLSVSQSTDGIFCMYYKLTDNVGNVSYYDGLGFKLDATSPQIQIYYTQKSSSTKQELAPNSSILLNKDIDVEAVITEANTDEIVLKINNEESNNYEVFKNDDETTLIFQLSAENGEDKSYEISITCTDMVGNSEEVKASVRIDKEFPIISKDRYSLESKWEDVDKKEYAFNEDVEVVLSIKDVHFDKSRSKVEIIKNNEPAVSLDTADNGYGTNDWTSDENNGIYKNTLKFSTGNKTDNRYIVKVTYTDDASNKVEYQETIIIDKEPPVVSINFTDGNTPVSANNREYYKGRTAVISVSETSSLDMNDFKTAIINGITVKDKDNQKIEVSNEENKFYTIQQSANSNSYTVIFTGDGNYEISISYTDKCENTTEQPAEGAFSIDNVPPQAKGKVLFYKYNNSTEQSTEYDLSTTSTDRFSYLSTYFEITGSNGSVAKYQSKFILTNIRDDLSGVNPDSVKYYLTEKPLGENDKLENITGWTNQDARLSNNNTEFIVTLPEAEKSTVYYIYYYLEDYAGNKAYYNGLGIKLDQDPPVISDFRYQTKGKTVSDTPITLENGEIVNQVYSFSDNVQVDFEVREDDFDEANTKIKIEKYNYLNNQYTDISDNIGKNKWNSSEGISTTSLSTESQIKEGEVNQFKITLEAVDKAGHKSTHTEIIRIDKEAPKITIQYQDALTERAAVHYYKKERTAKITVDKAIYSFITPEDFRKAVIIGISAKDKKNEDIIDAQYLSENITAAAHEEYEVKQGDTLIYKISGWDSESHSYTVTFNSDAIYGVGIEYVDDAGNSNNGVVLYDPQTEDGASFVIDREAPKITVAYDNTNMVWESYYQGERTATISVSDLSFSYSYYYDKEKEWIVTDITAENPFKTVEEPNLSKWIEKGDNTGVFQSTIIYNDDAIYTFKINDPKDICGNELAEKNVEYQNTEGEKINDGESFVIDRKAPKITITYQDSKENKQEDSYYKDSRTAEITVEDLSYIYEEKSAEALGEQVLLTPEKRITDNIKITSENAKGEDISEAFTDTGWIFDKESGVYKKILCFKKDAIYTFSILKDENGEDIPADIYNRNADISYINENDHEKVKDYAFFVISREAPNVIVTYKDNENNKQEDCYYKSEREADIIVSDLSFVFEDRKNNLSNSSLSVSNRLFINITAQNEKGQELESKDIYTLNDWSFDPENGIYKSKAVFTGDAIYSFSISGKNIYEKGITGTYKNEQGEEVTDYDSFVIDSAAPKYTVTYNDENKVTDYYENHFYNEKRIATMEVSDLSYVYEDQKRAEDEKKLAAEKRTNITITTADESGREVEDAYSEEEWRFDKEKGIYIKEITFSKDAVYQYTNSAEDIYGREAEFVYKSEQASAEENAKDIEDWASFVIDTMAPVITVTYDDRNKGINSKYENGFYMGDRTAYITVSDLSFIYADKYIPENIQTGNLILNEIGIDEKNIYIQPNIEAYSNDTEQSVEKAFTDADLLTFLSTLWSWNDEQNGYQAAITFTGEAHYKFTLTGKDICQKEADISYSDTIDANEFVIDKTEPVINITYDDNNENPLVRTIDQRGYFAKPRTATIVITEGKDTFDAEDAKNNIKITARNAAGQEVANAYNISGWTESKASQNGNATTYTATITYQRNANYDFSISYMDKSGRSASAANTNNSATPYTFTVDSQAPTGTISISGFGSWNRLVDLLTFDRWSNSTVNITVSAADEISSVYSIRYYKTPAFNAMTEQQLRELNDSVWTDYNEAFSVRPDERFTIYLRIEDHSGIVTFISSDGVIVDSTAPAEESIAPEITVNPVQPINNIYNTNVAVDITVTDPIVNNSYSGLRSIRYEVLNMGIVTQQGQLYTFNYTAGQTLQSQLLQRWNGQIVVDRNLNNSNDVRIVVYAQDNSNNSSSAYTSIQIDVTQPSIDITYDNNNGDATFANATYFNADRTATIRITERNFNENDVQITITNTDGVIPSISGWSTSSGTGNGDDTVHTATVTYSADGDYTFAVSYTDLAGNVNTAPDYGNSAAPEQFTIDKTLPIINVSYDNNSVQNDNYYSAARTATISITEHNFDTGRYNITLTASDDGADKAAPSIGGWSNNGDVHIATVQFADDGYYTMNMSYTDMAGNQAAQFTQHTFYVDQTMPRVAVKGIKNNTANNNETIGFKITCTDTNFDVFTPQLTVTKMVDGSNKTENCVMDQVASIRNGQTYTVENLDQDGIYSLTCTARDKAGNVFNRVVYLNDADQEESGMDASEGLSFLNFSVNRKGSVYTLEPYADEVAEYYYVREVDDDIVIIETNVDTLKGYIELNGNRLTEGTDYQVEISGGNGEWYVVRYIINKDLFANEGEYKIVVYSEDDAGNTAYSDIKGTNLSFVVDRTAPVVTVSGIEDNGRYQVERQTVTVIPKDDGGKLQKITIEAFDQNGDMLDGFPIVYEGEELLKLLEENNGELSFELPEGTGMSVRITCEDSAGNEMEVMSFNNIVVSTSRLTIILASKTFYYVISAIILVIAAAVVGIIVWKKRQKSNKGKNRKTEE